MPTYYQNTVQSRVEYPYNLKKSTYVWGGNPDSYIPQ